MRYSMPGSRRRSSSPAKSMRRRQSMIRPSDPTRMTLELRPIISTISAFPAISPISSRDSRSKRSMRSWSGCVTERIRAPTRCLRSSMQNIGGSAGFSIDSVVKCTRAFPVPAAISSLPLPCFPRTERSSRSRSGCCTFSILAPSSCGASSAVSACRQMASSGMVYSSIIRAKSSDRRSLRPSRYSHPNSASKPVALWYSATLDLGGMPCTLAFLPRR